MPDGRDDPKDEQSNVSEEEEVMSEVIERAMEGNIKILLGNEIFNSNMSAQYANLALKSAVNFQEKANNAYLERIAEKSHGFQTHRDEMNKQIVENNRFTLDRLYGLFPPEASEIATILKALLSSGIITVNPPETQTK